MLVKTYGSSVIGVDARIISVEVNVGGGGLLGYKIVGLPDNAVKESWMRVEAALRFNDFRMPRTKVVINLAPADLKKEGSCFDLPIAVGILAATEQIDPAQLSRYVIMGELSLDGEIQPIRGSLPIALKAKAEGFSGFILPAPNAAEAAMVEALNVYGAKNLQQLFEFLEGKTPIAAHVSDAKEGFRQRAVQHLEDFADVKGQESIKRAMEIAAAGGHNAILIGPPGAGKTMLAKRLPTILPPLTLSEALETTKIHSVAGRLQGGDALLVQRPFRAPHHTLSDVALVGGGKLPQPGEISLAHNGVLFLDELPEFKRSVLEVLRQPMEERQVTIARARLSVTYPSNFMLIASMNPCPCGFFNHPDKDCSCLPGQVHKYLNRISGPLMDRIDLHIEVTPVPVRYLARSGGGESSASIRKRVVAARDMQLRRFDHIDGVHCNAMLGSTRARELFVLDKGSRNLLDKAMKKLGLSARAYDRIIKMSRTIADIEGQDIIRSLHVAEAIQYRSLDRESWALG